VKLQGERQEKKQQHWEKVIVSACEQSGRARLPKLNASASLVECLASDNSEQRLVLHHRSNGKLPKANVAPVSILLLIGPEGGLSENEIAQAEQAGCVPWTLGPRVLRTETAPLAALSILQYKWGDL
jgi:16S rRNA (uracil1498-N3)-methyltransferase